MAKFVFRFNTKAMRRKSIDIARARYNTAARELEAQALASETPVERDAMQRLAGQLRDRAASLRGINAGPRMDTTLKALVKDSEFFLRSSLNDDWMRGEALGNLRLNGTAAGHRFYSITEPLWTGSAPGKRLDAIRKAVTKNPEIVKRFGRRPNTQQLVQIIEEATGINLNVDDEFLSGSPDKEQFLNWVNVIMRRYG